MSTLYLQLLNIPVTKEPLDTARSYIAIKGSSSIKVDGKEFKTVSAECRTLREVEEAADGLIKELKTIKKQAEKFFKNEDDARRKMLGQSTKR
jgi:hypothetical protein